MVIEMVRNGQILGILEGQLPGCLDRLDCDRNGAWTQCAYVASCLAPAVIAVCSLGDGSKGGY